MKAVVFGLGKLFARFMLFKERYLPSLELLCICDNDAFLAGNRFSGIPVIAFDGLRAAADEADVILIATGSGASAKIAEQIRGAKIKKKMYWLNERKLNHALDAGGQCPPVVDKWGTIAHVFDAAGPVLPYIECDIVDHCNLNCRGCGHASNIAPKGILDIEVFQRDFERLAECYSNIEKIRLLGGEPLLHPRLTDFLRIARRTFPKATLCIATNGLLVPRMGDDLFSVMRACRARFDVTCYLPTHKEWRKILQAVRQTGVGVQLSGPAVSFFKWFGRERKDPAAVFADCGLNCTTICQGKLSRCGMGVAYNRIARRFGLQKEKDTGLVDIYEEGMDGWEINERIKEPFSLCGHCRSVHNWQEKMLRDEAACFEWRCDGTPELDDWFQA